MDLFFVKKKTKRKEYLSFALFRVSPSVREKKKFVCELGLIHQQYVSDAREAGKFWKAVTERLESIGGELGEVDRNRIIKEVALDVPHPEPPPTRSSSFPPLRTSLRPGFYMKKD